MDCHTIRNREISDETRQNDLLFCFRPTIELLPIGAVQSGVAICTKAIAIVQNEGKTNAKWFAPFIDF
jgi:hypothetical protein